jgi:pimeloyl-ACP methyl ester carboxylesterase
MVTPPDNSSLYKSAAGYQKVMAHYDTSFQKMGVPYETKYVETRFGPTHTVISGNKNGKSVVLWHGGHGNSTLGIDDIIALAPTYRVYAIDTIGEMGKSAPSRPPRAGPAYGQWAADALEGLGLKQANMIGISNGGWLILKLAGVAPEKIGSAILVSAAGLQPLSIKFALRFFVPYLTKSPAEAARRFWEILSPPELPLDPDTLEFFELMLREYRIWVGKGPPVVSETELRRLTAPTYLLMGQYEVTFAPGPYKVLERGLNLLPNVITAEIVPGVGHMMIHKRPDWVIARVISFLERYAV